MTDVPTAPASETPRERGWWRVVIATLLFLFVPMTPLFRIVFPVDQTLLLLAPALAACAVVGWLAGGRLPLAVLWTGLAGWVMWKLTGGGGTFAFLAAGWAVLLAAAFAGFALMGSPRSFFPRALGTIGLTLLLAGGAVLATPNGAASVRQAVTMEVGRRAEQSAAGWRQMTESKEWRDFVVQNPDAATLATEVDTQLQALPAVTGTLFPAMLALESLAALALAWAVFHRIGRARLGPPLGTLREFRFNDQLVWGLIAGLVMVLVPGFTVMRGLGANLLMFFGVVYALRGAGVALWFLAPGRFVMALLIGFAVLFWHVIGVLALGLGLGDTWADWRSRAKPKT
jgi:hypothetical protein